MADAGRIVIIPKGEYKNNVTYERLDAVLYNGKGYIALKTVTGVTPVADGENWQIYVDNVNIDVDNLKPNFEISSERKNIFSGETLSAILGKIKKYFSDIKEHAFKDLATTFDVDEIGTGLDATVGKELNDKLNTNGYGEFAGGKNLFHYRDAKIETTSCSYTFSNNSISITSNSNNAQIVIRGIKVKKNTDYILSVGAITNALSDTAILVYRADNSKNVGGSLTNPSNRSFKISKGDYDEVFVILRHSQNSVASSDKTLVWNNIQIEEGNTSTQYEPYYPSNKMLAEEKADKSETAVNILNPTLQTTTQDGVTCTNNGDGTYALNGTASGTTIFALNDIQLSAGNYKMVGCVKGGSNNTYKLDVFSGTLQTTYLADYGDGKIENVPALNGTIRIVVYANTTVNNLIFKPMITTNLNATYDDFVPYTGDTGSLNSDVASLLKRIQALESQSASATSKLCSDAIDDLASVVSTQDEAIDELATIVTESEEK
jgi:hypothetical protein|nr:MAG TPA: hypothetical protein [Bacteriophage sp.]